MAKNYIILRDFPKPLIKSIREEYLGANTHNKKLFDTVVLDEFQTYILVRRPHNLYNIMDKVIKLPYKNIMFLYSAPNAGMGPIHIDSSRSSSINIPIEVDYNNTCFFIAHSPCTEIPPDEKTNKGSKRYAYEPENYDFYNVREPILLNTKAPHSFFVHSDQPRILMSISFDQHYEDLRHNCELSPHYIKSRGRVATLGKEHR